MIEFHRVWRWEQSQEYSQQSSFLEIGIKWEKSRVSGGEGSPISALWLQLELDRTAPIWHTKSQCQGSALETSCSEQNWNKIKRKIRIDWEENGAERRLSQQNWKNVWTQPTESNQIRVSILFLSKQNKIKYYSSTLWVFVNDFHNPTTSNYWPAERNIRRYLAAVTSERRPIGDVLHRFN